MMRIHTYRHLYIMSTSLFTISRSVSSFYQALLAELAGELADRRIHTYRPLYIMSTSLFIIRRSFPYFTRLFSRQIWLSSQSVCDFLHHRRAAPSAIHSLFVHCLKSFNKKKSTIKNHLTHFRCHPSVPQTQDKQLASLSRLCTL